MNKINNIKVSICIPSFNQTRYLKNTLDSILTQTFRNYEIVICDDSSTEKVKKLINRYNFQGKLRYFRNKTILGPPENWNRTVKLAKGKYIKILHHDDWFSQKNSLKKFVDLLDSHPEADFAFSATLARDHNGKILFTHTANTRQIKSLKINSEILFLENFIGAPSATIYKRSLNLKYDKNLQWFVDVDFYIKVLAKNNRFVYSPEPLINVTADATHQVTKSSFNNKGVELFESIYLYSKIKSLEIRIKYFMNIFYLLKKYQVLSINDVPKKDRLKIPVEIKIAIKINKLLKLL
jgi:glycosyltransferase involved in cell wall biosynthesis